MFEVAFEEMTATVFVEEGDHGYSWFFCGLEWRHAQV